MNREAERTSVTPAPIAEKSHVSEYVQMTLNTRQGPEIRIVRRDGTSPSRPRPRLQIPINPVR